MRPSYARAVLLACGALIVVVVRAHAAVSPRAFAAHIEAGLGPTVVRPLEVERAAGITGCGGASLPVAGVFRAAVEFAATAGGQWGGLTIPEASTPGDRTLMTLLFGVEITQEHSVCGPFAFLGAGGGRSTLKNARGEFAPPYGDNWILPPRSVTGLAVGAGAGYRFGGGPGPLGFQVAFRTHALIDSGIPTSAYAVTIGVAY